jgi:hypothetical protein
VSDHGEWKLHHLEPGEMVQIEVKFVCPFCGGKGFVTIEPAMVAHLEPPCETFIALEPVAYLRAMRLAKVRAN